LKWSVEVRDKEKGRELIDDIDAAYEKVNAESHNF
jgi:hypothetical protein